MANVKTIAGAGGGGGGGKGGGGHTATEDPDSLQSRAMISILDLIGEGQIGGLVDGAKSIFLNDTPLQNSDGSYNFGDSTLWSFKNGSQLQTPHSLVADTETPHAMGVKVTSSSPRFFTVTNSEVDSVNVIMSFPSLTYTNPENGDVHGTSVQYKFAISTDGGPYVDYGGVQSVDGKSRSKYQVSHLLSLTKPFSTATVRVSRVSADATVSTLQNESWIESYSEVINSRLSYPNSAVAAIRVDSMQFGSVPSRSYLVDGMMIQIPSNYNPLTNTYTGIWPGIGAFNIAVSSNPAWVLYDLLTNKRYGLGDFINPSMIDVAKLYTIGKYCDELVPDGFGGTEKRFELNTQISGQKDAYKTISDITSCFRGMTYWSGGLIGFSQDAPAEPGMIYTDANVIGGMFTYSGSARKDRHSVVLVTYNDPDDLYRQKIEYVEDPELVIRYGVRKADIVAFGCTSRGQAARIGRWLLYTERYESDVITFSVGMDSAFVHPGDVIQISDKQRVGKRMGGRLLSATSTSATLDSAITLSAPGATISMRLPDGTFATRTVLEGAGAHSVMTWVSVLPSLPDANAMFIITEPSLAPVYARVVSVAQGKGDNTYGITALEHQPGKFDAIENGVKLAPVVTSTLSTIPGAPTGLVLADHMYLSGPNVSTMLDISWDGGALGIRSWEVKVREALGNWKKYTVSMPSLDVPGVRDGVEYFVEVRATNVLSNVGPVSAASRVIVGKTLPPPVFDFFTVMAQPDGTRQYNFGYTTIGKPVDWLGAEIRYTPGTIASPDWNLMTNLQDAETYYTNSPVELNAPLSGEWTFACKSLDTTGNESAMLVRSLTLPNRRLGNVFDEFFEKADGWLGTKTGCHIQDGILEANDSTTWSGLPSTWDAWSRWNTTPASPITYVTPVRDFATIVAGQFNATVDADGTVLLEIATSTDGTTWSAWGSAASAFSTRFLKARLTVTATGPAPVPVVRDFTYQINAPIKSEYINDVAISTLTGSYRIGVGDIRIPLVGTYSFLKRTSIVVQDNSAGTWTYARIDQSLSPAPRWQFRLNGVLADPQFVDFFIEGF